MRVRDIMSHNVAYAKPSDTIQQACRIMRDNDCGCIPVLDASDGNSLLGVLTDRDVACRVAAEGRSPSEVQVRDCMSSPVITVRPDMSIEQCEELMQRHMIRRVPVSSDGRLCQGMVSLADIAQSRATPEVGALLSEVSRPTRESSRT